MTSPSELETSNAIVAGQGSMGRVFRVDADVYNALTVPELASSDYSALKVLERPSLRQRFVDEFGMLRRLSSPIFVHAQRLGVLRENQQLTSQLEWCRGTPLSTISSCSTEEIRILATELMRGLEHLHRHHVIHGDLSPENVLWDKGQPVPVKLLDLGAAGLSGSGAGFTSGRLDFTAPERLAGAPLSATSDLWSAGAVLFACLHGCHPFPDYPRVIETGKGPMSHGLRPSPLDPWLSRLLAQEPSDRFQSAQQALSALDVITNESTPLIRQDRIAARFERAPYLDSAGLLADLELRLSEAIDSFRGTALDIVGPPGAGTSRLLDELGSLAAAKGIRPIHVDLRMGQTTSELLSGMLARIHPRASTERNLRPETMALARRIISALKAQTQPHVLLVDNADLANEETRRALSMIEQASLQPLLMDYPTLLFFARRAGDESRPSIKIAPWSSQSISQYLESIFPGRRVSEQLKREATERSMGLPKRLLQWCVRAAEVRALTLSDTTLSLSDTVQSPEVYDAEDARDLSLSSLEDHERRVVELIACARAPLPLRLLDDERSQISSLTARGIVALVTQDSELRVTLRQPLEAPIDSKDVLIRLAQRWESCLEQQDLSERAKYESLYYSVRAEEEDARSRARSEITRSQSSKAAPLLSLLVDEQWPGTSHECMAAAEVAKKAGMDALSCALIERTLKLTTEPDDRLQAHLRLGGHEAEAARHSGAIEHFTEALALANSEGLDATDVHSALARSLMLTGELEAAEDHCKDALAGIPAEDEARLGPTLYTAGLLAWYRGDLQAAEHDCTRALSYAQRVGDERELAAVVTAVGLVAHRQSDLEGATECYQRALRLGEDSGDATRILTSLQNMAVVYHQSGEISRALSTYQEAYGMAEALLQTGRVIQLAANQGKLWRYLGQFEQARRSLNRGLELSLSEDNSYLAALCLLARGEVELEQGELDEASKSLTSCLEKTGLEETRVETIEAILTLSEVLRLKHDEACIDWARRARRLAEASSQDALLARSCGVLASCIRTLTPDETEQANAVLEAGLAKMDAIQNPEYRIALLLEAAQLAEVRGDRETLIDAARLLEALVRQLTDSVPALYRASFSSRSTIDRVQQLIGRTAEEVEMSKGQTSQIDEDRWNRLLAVTHQLASERDIEKLLRFIMDSAVLLCGAERGFLLLVAPEQPEGVKIRVARNIDQENIRKTRLKISMGIARRVIAEQEPTLTIDAMEDERYRDQMSVHDLKLRSVLCLPMVVRGKSLGAIYLDNRFRRSVFEPHDVEHMQAFADQAALALANAQLLQSMEKARSELQASQEQVLALNEKLREQIQAQALELETTQRALIEQQRQLGDSHRYDRIIGTSKAMTAVFRVMDRLLSNTVPVLIEGESGTGKELVARAIHFNGSRASEPFIAVNCAAIPASLIESELFGHLKGSFTGATSDRQGLFEAAHKGTLLLDELGELPLEMQVKLLRVLQTGEVQKVGASHPKAVDVRVIAATNRTLKTEISEGRFREDLYYRLAVIPITLPPLRQRREDIPLLVEHFLSRHTAQGIGKVDSIQKSALKRLLRYEWPGNIRQLEMVLKNAALFCDGTSLTLSDFSAFPEIIELGQTRSAETSLSGRTLADIERAAVLQALTDTNGNKKRAAEQLGIDRRTLYNKIAAYDIVIERGLKVR